METGIIVLELRSFEKYKARSDVKKPTWFKCSNDIFDDDDLFDFSLEEMAVWCYVMAQSSKQQSQVVRISIRKASARISLKLLNATIDKLVKLGIVTKYDPDTLRARNVDVTSACETRTLEEIRRDLKDEKREDAPAAPPSQGFLNQGEDIGNVAGLQGNSLLDQVLPQVSIAIQRSWVETFDSAWLKLCLVRAVEHHMGRAAAQRPNDIKDWSKKFSAWLGHERDPKLRAKPKILRPKEESTPWPIGAKERALGDLSALKAMGKVTAAK